jgi:hypothetical protein
MGDKRQETLTKYLGDMRAVVGHTRAALERQREEFKDRPEAVQVIGRIEGELAEQLDRLGTELERLGGSPTAPVKEAVATAAGAVAGLYDKMRTEGTAKALRDDYVALSLCYVAWSMLHTTAATLTEPGVTRIAEQGMRECSRAIMTVDALIPFEVVNELRDSGIRLEEGAAETTRKVSTDGWESERARALSESGTPTTTTRVR